MAFLGGIGFQEIIILLPVFLLMILWVVALIDIVRSDFKDGNQKIVWVLIVVLVPIIGPILYFAMGRTGRVAP